MEAVAKRNSGAGDHVCPWWVAYTFDNALRRLVHPPEKVLAGYVHEGMRVMDVGCGFGHFTLGMARMVGDEGRVTAVDVQDKMLEKTWKRALKAGLDGRIALHRCDHDVLGVSEAVDFALASNVVHELADPVGFFAEVRALLPHGGVLYVMEPAGHIRPGRFEEEVKLALDAGFGVVERPKLVRERCVVLKKSVDG